VAGQVRFPLLDLGWWNSDASGPSAATQSPGDGVPAYVFDDRPITGITDHGVNVDLDLGVNLLDLGRTQLHALAVVARLSGQRLELEPFSLQGAAGGKYAGRFVLDGGGAKPTVDLQVDGQGVRLGLAAVEGQDPATIPETELHADLHGSGATAREMASGLNGALRMYTGPGLVPAAGLKLLFNDFLTELFSLLNPFAEKSPYTRMECSVAAADIVNGLVSVSPLLLNTEEITILSQGTIDLRTENIDLSFNTKPRKGLGLSTSVLINPFIKVGGRLAEPAIELDPKRAAVSGGAAVATAGLSLLAKSFSDRFLSSKDPCGDARKEGAGRVLGCGGMGPLVGGPPGVCELRKMYFLPELRGAGMGSRLLGLILDAARAAGYDRCYLESLGNMTDARRLYLKHGFRPIDGPLGNTGHSGCNSWMVRDL
jgi:GNAT superfamily N-acetyltransferase